MIPIAVEMNERETLTMTSRINYAKISTLEHNCRVRIIGAVLERDLDSLLSNCEIQKPAHHA